MFKKIIMVGCIAFLFSTAVFSAEPEVSEIVKKANLASYYAGKDGKSDVKMTIIDSQNCERIREFTVLCKNLTDGGD